MTSTLANLVAFLALYIIAIICIISSKASGSIPKAPTPEQLQSNMLNGNLEVDVSWDFNVNGALEGFANATVEEMKMDVRVENGQLRGSIVGAYFTRRDANIDPPNIDSPHLFLQMSRLHYFVIRAMYYGAATDAKLLLKTGQEPARRDHIDHSKSYWRDIMKAIAISDSPTTPDVNNVHSKAMLSDNNLYTYYLSDASSAVSLILDLGDPRWISSIAILPIGDSRSPRQCLLQRSMTSGVGPFETVTTFTMLSSTTLDRSEFQTFRYFEGHSRYWKLLIFNNYGGAGIGIREVRLEGFEEDIMGIPFKIDNTGVFKNYYVPVIYNTNGLLLRFRLELTYGNDVISNMLSGGKLYQEGISIDYIRIARVPGIYKVLGCLDKYFPNENLVDGVYDVTKTVEWINDRLPLRSFIKNQIDGYPYATTYDCPRTGNVPITVQGINFGPKAIIYVGGKVCDIISYSRNPDQGREETFVCNLPSMDAEDEEFNKYVRIENGVLPGLYRESQFLNYRVAPPVLTAPNVTNLGAHRIDLVWRPPPNDFEAMTVTGYKILWFQPKYPSRISNVTVGNITTTSIRGLEPATEYIFAIAPVAEGLAAATYPTDLYGRRELTPDAFVGTFSVYTNVSATLEQDFDFSFFNANSTLNSSGVGAAVNNGKSFSVSSDGPTGEYGAEGHYGLVVVGDANIQNCNVSSSCCDGYDVRYGVKSCKPGRSVCAVLPALMLAYDVVIDGITRRQVPSNLPYDNGALPEISFLTLDELIANQGAELPKTSCGPALRLTPSEARRSGASWYRKKMNVREGFDTTFKFEISNPSQRCDRLDDVNTYCRSRGADGFAFVIQNVGPVALGGAGQGLGYEGIFNSLAIEVDTYANFENMDFYENHISIMTGGWRYNISANHSRGLATTTKIPDLTDGRHAIRIRYDPVFDANAVPHPSFQVNGYSSWFFENADFENGGTGDWGAGFGILYVYIDDLYSPVLATPMNLQKTLKLDDGRAYVGFTGATGVNHWQAHDILEWQFRSLFRDIPYFPPLRVMNGENGLEGDQQCVNSDVCVNFVDYSHYMRTHNIWGKGHDSTEGFQTGSEGIVYHTNIISFE